MQTHLNKKYHFRKLDCVILDKIEDSLKELKLTKMELGRRIGVPRAQISLVLCRIRKDRVTLKKIIEYLYPEWSIATGLTHLAEYDFLWDLASLMAQADELRKRAGNNSALSRHLQQQNLF